METQQMWVGGNRVGALGLMLAALVLAASGCNGKRADDRSGARVGERQASSGAAMLVWRTGVDAPEGRGRLVEAITQMEEKGRRIWRVTHYDQDPTSSATNDFDLYDVDASSEAPIRSVMQNSEFRLELVFGREFATLRRTSKKGNAEEKIPLANTVMPEGPGFTVFVGSLPLREGFTKQYSTVDRWSGSGATRVKEMTLRVTGRRTVPTAMGTKDAFEVETRAGDGSFRIVEQVRATAPHYPFRLEYTRDGKTMVSDVVSMALDRMDD